MEVQADPLIVTRKQKPENTNLPRLFIIAGLVLMAAFVLILKDRPQAETASSDLPEAQLERALEAGQPAFAFFHSDNCHSCIEMIAIVEKVSPEYSSSVVIVDVNVYAEENQSLMHKERIQYIPTLIFYDPAGTREVMVGVVTAEALSQKLAAIQENP